MSAHLSQAPAAVWLLLGFASYWYVLESESVDLFEFFGRKNWYLGAAVVSLLGALTLPTYFILKWGRK